MLDVRSQQLKVPRDKAKGGGLLVDRGRGSGRGAVELAEVFQGNFSFKDSFAGYRSM